MADSEALSLSVGELTAFSRKGDINFRFSAQSSAEEGIRGHQIVQARRGPGYEKEVTISERYVIRGRSVVLQGRIDGVDRSESPPVLEEIKTVRVEIGDIPDSVTSQHWLQASLYAAMFAAREDLQEIMLRLCYFHVDSEVESVQTRVVSREGLLSILDDSLTAFVSWRLERENWIRQRNQWAESVDFPFSTYRNGQRDMSVAVYRAMVENQRLVMQAPTGIGKSMGVLFPAVKSLPGRYDTVFYVSARTPGQLAAQMASEKLTEETALIRTVTLTAKEKICFTPGAPCHPDHCDYAQGYFDRHRDAVRSILDQDSVLTRERIESHARQVGLCPFELSLDLAVESDLVICDYNYVFDPTVYLRRFFERPGRYGLLVDESHNLVERGRSMFSADLRKSTFLALARSSDKSVRSRSNSVNRAFLSLRSEHREILNRENHVQFEKPPVTLLSALRRFCESMEDVLEQNGTGGGEQPLLGCYFDALRFLRTAENFDSTYVCYLTADKREIRIELFCVDPSPHLATGFDRMRSAICFSATMRPQTYFSKLLGLGGEAAWYRLSSPFLSEHLGVYVAGHIGTDYRSRDGSIDELAELIDGVVRARRGNYLVYFPSYTYLNKVRERVHSDDYDLIVQEREMNDDARQAFLAHFKPGRERGLVGLAVMGGAFAEGIDLKGEALIGVIVVGVGLPQINVRQDLIRAYFQDVGFEFAYQYPGMNKVLQTAGRVIRDSEDKGVVVLVDRRFSQQRYREMFPAEWQVRDSNESARLIEKISDFWGLWDRA